MVVWMGWSETGFGVSESERQKKRRSTKKIAWMGVSFWELLRLREVTLPRRLSNLLS